MGDPLRHVLYAPRLGKPTVEVLEVTGYSARDGAYLVGERRFHVHALVLLTDAQATHLETLPDDERALAARRLALEKRTEGIREACG